MVRRSGLFRLFGILLTGGVLLAGCGAERSKTGAGTRSTSGATRPEQTESDIRGRPMEEPPVKQDEGDAHAQRSEQRPATAVPVLELIELTIPDDGDSTGHGNIVPILHWSFGDTISEPETFLATGFTEWEVDSGVPFNADPRKRTYARSIPIPSEQFDRKLLNPIITLVDLDNDPNDLVFHGPAGDLPLDQAHANAEGGWDFTEAGTMTGSGDSWSMKFRVSWVDSTSPTAIRKPANIETVMKDLEERAQDDRAFAPLLLKPKRDGEYEIEPMVLYIQRLRPSAEEVSQILPLLSWSEEFQFQGHPEPLVAAADGNGFWELPAGIDYAPSKEARASRIPAYETSRDDLTFRIILIDLNSVEPSKDVLVLSKTVKHPVKNFVDLLTDNAESVYDFTEHVNVPVFGEITIGFQISKRSVARAKPGGRALELLNSRLAGWRSRAFGF